MRGSPDPRSGLGHVGDPLGELESVNQTHISRRVGEAAAAVRRETDLVPRAAVVLGSGLGGVADRLRLEPENDGETRGASLATADLPHWPRSTVAGHAGRLVLGYWNDVPAVVLRGRSHRYEGYGLDSVTYSIRVMRELGAEVLFLTNAVGSMNPLIGPGSLMLVRDHLNFQGTRGLLSPAEFSRTGDPCVIRPTPVYSPRLIALLREVALEMGIRLEEGVLMGGQGPAYETASEVQTARRWGADAACMSTVTEALVGASLGFEIGVVSCVTNLATGLSDRPLTHDEVTEVADRVTRGLEELLGNAMARAMAARDR
jgi:purine-nucleoside phosphorylase